MDFSNREIATAVWLAALVGFALLKGVGGSIMAVLRAFLAPKVAGPFFLMAAWTALCAWLLSLAHLWTWANLKTTILWACAFAFVAMLNAAQARPKDHPVRWVVGETLTITAVVLFLADSFSFPLWMELALVPLVMLVAGMQVVADHDPKTAVLKTPLKVIMAVFTLLIIGNGLYGAITDLAELASLDTAREFAVPVLLSFLFLPFLLTFGAVVDYETALTSLSFRNLDPKLLRYAAWRAALTFGWNRDYVQRWKRRMTLDEPADRAGVDAVIRELRETRWRERQPPPVAPGAGWSPYVARDFLAEAELPARDYHRSFDEWFADSELRRFRTGIFDSTMSYSLAGNALAATRLKLSLDARRPGHTDEVDRLFYDLAGTLLARVGVDDAAAVVAGLAPEGRGERRVNGLRVVLARSDWGDEKMGGYGRRFVICHPADNGEGDY